FPGSLHIGNNFGRGIWPYFQISSARSAVQLVQIARLYPASMTKSPRRTGQYTITEAAKELGITRAAVPSRNQTKIALTLNEPTLSALSPHAPKPRKFPK